MRCLYCEVEVTSYPENGICQHCGGRLPPKPAQQQSAPQPFVQNLYVNAAPQPPLTAGVNCCPECYSTEIIRKKRGFSWGLAILGFFLIPVLGPLLGFCGKKTYQMHCLQCKHKWAP